MERPSNRARVVSPEPTRELGTGLTWVLECISGKRMRLQPRKGSARWLKGGRMGTSADGEETKPPPAAKSPGLKMEKADRKY